MPLRRGFKAEAERLAKDIWGEMSLTPNDPMDAEQLAEHVGCVVRPADALVDIGKLRKLRRIQHDAFFACTFKLPGNRTIGVAQPEVHQRRVVHGQRPQPAPGGSGRSRPLACANEDQCLGGAHGRAPSLLRRVADVARAHPLKRRVAYRSSVSEDARRVGPGSGHSRAPPQHPTTGQHRVDIGD